MLGTEFHGHPSEWFVSRFQELVFSVSQPKEDWRSRLILLLVSRFCVIPVGMRACVKSSDELILAHAALYLPEE